MPSTNASNASSKVKRTEEQSVKVARRKDITRCSRCVGTFESGEQKIKCATCLLYTHSNCVLGFMAGKKDLLGQFARNTPFANGSDNSFVHLCTHCVSEVVQAGTDLREFLASNNESVQEIKKKI